MDLAEFIAKYEMKFVHFDDMYGAQCMDLYRVYVREVLGFEQSALVRNAAAVYHNYPAKHWERIANGRTNFPLPGDVVIWSKWYSRSLTGHIAIAESATINDLVCFSQNDPGGSPAILKRYNYRHVLGWLHPRAVQ